MLPFTVVIFWEKLMALVDDVFCILFGIGNLCQER
jgi:hypothetical protein